MRSYKEAVAFAEMARIQRKIRCGNATPVERERYQYFLQPNVAGDSARLHSSSPPPAFRTTSTESEEQGWQATDYDDVMWKRVPSTPTSIKISAQATAALEAVSRQALSSQIKHFVHHSTQAPPSTYLKSKSVAYHKALRLAQERASQWSDTGRNTSHQMRYISSSRPSPTTRKDVQPSESCANEKKRLLVPIPIRDKGDGKRQKLIPSTSSSNESSALIGILCSYKTQSPANNPQTPKIDPSAFMRAMRASQATRGKQRSILDALRKSSSGGPTGSAFESHKNPSTKKTEVAEERRAKSSHEQESRPLTSQEEATRARRLAWMRSATEIMSQNLPQSVLKKDIKSSQNVSTTHLLRRIGNPHRRVIHQMLRDQNKRILKEMKEQVAAKTASSRNASPSTDAQAPAKASISK